MKITSKGNKNARPSYVVNITCPKCGKSFDFNEGLIPARSEYEVQCAECRTMIKRRAAHPADAS